MSDMQRSSDSPPQGTVPPEIEGAPKIAAPATGQGEIVASGTPQLDEAHRSFSEFHQGYVSNYIQFADTKAAWIFAIAAGLVVYILDKNDLKTLLCPPDQNLYLWALVATAALLIASAVFSFLVVLPRLPASGEGIVSFFSVAKKPSADSYVREIASMTDAALTEARLKHSYTISGVCRRKYAHLRCAFITGMLGLAGTALLTLLA
ncbi:Pycsar system effector family protein [Steroidobacter flavus]|uniref:Pycsar system effector family protein n=1 Tax=Steroidobacter flavus TaxID=1842136 RepID=A0ABV8SP54_9GAMM